MFCSGNATAAAVDDNYYINKADILEIEDITDEVIDQPVAQLRKHFTNEAWDLAMEIGIHIYIAKYIQMQILLFIIICYFTVQQNG